MPRNRSKRILWFFFLPAPDPLVSGKFRFVMLSATEARPDLMCGDAIIHSSDFTSACFPLCAQAEPFPLQDNQASSTTSSWAYLHFFYPKSESFTPESSSTLTRAVPWERVPVLPLINGGRQGARTDPRTLELPRSASPFWSCRHATDRSSSGCKLLFFTKHTAWCMVYEWSQISLWI